MSFLLHAADVMWWSWWSGLCTLSFSDSLSSGTCQPFCWQLLMLSSRMQILVLLSASWCLWGFFVNLYRRSCSECIWHCMQPMSTMLQTWLFLLWYYKSKQGAGIALWWQVYLDISNSELPAAYVVYLSPIFRVYTDLYLDIDSSFLVDSYLSINHLHCLGSGPLT
jgi:hypothetical protein